MTISLPLTRDPGSFPTAIANIERAAIPSVSFGDFGKPSKDAPGPQLRSSNSDVHARTRPPTNSSTQFSRQLPTTRTAERTKARHGSESVRMTVTTSTTKGFKDLPPSPSLPYTLKLGLNEPSSTSSLEPVAYGSPFDPNERIEDWRNDILDTVLRGLQEVSLDLDNENYRGLFDSHVSVESTISAEPEVPRLPLKLDRRSFLDMDPAETISSQQLLKTSPSLLSRVPATEAHHDWGYRGFGRKAVMVEKQVTVDYDDFATGLDSKAVGVASQSTFIDRK